MKVKPKEVLLNLPTVFLFEDSDEIPSLASNVNTFIHGKVKIKCEELGVLDGQVVGIFYLQRNNEYQDLRNRFMSLIEQSELVAAGGIIDSIDDDEVTCCHGTLGCSGQGEKHWCENV